MNYPSPLYLRNCQYLRSPLSTKKKFKLQKPELVPYQWLSKRKQPSSSVTRA